MRYAYYPGCSLHASAKEYDMSWRAVAERLGIELDEIEDWNCCGTVHAGSVDRDLGIVLSARNLGIVEGMGLDVAVPCSGCFKNLWTASDALKQDVDLRSQVNAGMGSHPFAGTAKVKHPLYILVDDIGLDVLKDLPRPLEGLRVAPYYGCMITRPAADPPLDDPEDPQGLDRLLAALGADVVPYPAKTRCCGGAVLLSHTDVAVGLVGDLLQQAKDAGAECVAVACPMCQMALDAYQSKAEKRRGGSLDMPIFYFTQLLGLAMGVDLGHLGLGRLVISPNKVLARV